MGRINAVIPDDLEKRLRARVAEKYGGKKGGLALALSEAIGLWLDLQGQAGKRK